MILDTHAHIHTEGIKPEAKERFSKERYWKTKGPVEMALIIGMMFKSIEYEIPNDSIADLVEADPTHLAGFASLYPDDPKGPKELERLVKQRGLIGLKLSPTFQNFYPHDKKVHPLYKKCVELGIPVAYHAGSSLMMRTARVLYGDVRYIDEVAQLFPELRIIICHMGYSQYIDTLDIVKKQPNVYADCSNSHLAGLAPEPHGHLPSVHYPYFHWVQPLLYYFCTQGDQDKLLFGTEYPSTTGAACVSALENLPDMLKGMGLPPIPQQRIHNILHENWKRVFKLDGKGRLAPATW